MKKVSSRNIVKFLAILSSLGAILGFEILSSYTRAEKIPFPITQLGILGPIAVSGAIFLVVSIGLLALPAFMLPKCGRKMLTVFYSPDGFPSNGTRIFLMFPAVPVLLAGELCFSFVDEIDTIWILWLGSLALYLVVVGRGLRTYLPGNISIRCLLAIFFLYGVWALVVEVYGYSLVSGTGKIHKGYAVSIVTGFSFLIAFVHFSLRSAITGNTAKLNAIIAVSSLLLTLLIVPSLSYTAGKLSLLMLGDGGGRPIVIERASKTGDVRLLKGRLLLGIGKYWYLRATKNLVAVPANQIECFYFPTKGFNGTDSCASYIQ